MIPRSLLAAAALLLGTPAAAGAVPRLPVTLPGDAAAASVNADPGTWIVGARPGAAPARIARAHGARSAGPAGAYVVARSRAAGLAAALRRHRALAYAQPNALRRTAAAPPDPLDAEYGWRAFVVDGATPPAVTARSPLIALVDAALDPTHPEFAHSNITTLGGEPITESHGTATASVAAAPRNGIGLSGLWPDARTLNIPGGSEGITCASSADGIERAIRAHASVVNMSYGSAASSASQICVPEWAAIEDAVRHGIVPVAAAGNERTAKKDPLEYPASLPHVVTVGALRPDAQGHPVAAGFSEANPYVDISAPGVGIPVAVPIALDPDGDGYDVEAGTSFSAPMVSATVAWVRARRPRLSEDQAAGVVIGGARDIAPRGWDPKTGAGVLSVRRAVHHRAPRRDPLEPNDAPYFVDGTVFRAARPISRHGQAARLRATVDAAEDPDDFYRVIVPAHASMRATVHPHGGPADLTAYVARGSDASYVRIARSHGRGTRRLRLDNTSSRRAELFVGVDAAARHRGTVRYRLVVRSA